MSSIARQKKLLQIVRETESISVQALVERLEASPATVRRDLIQLEEAGKVLRTHGAVLDRRNLEGEPSFSIKRQRVPEIKRRIGRAVADEIAPGATVFIDAGTTCLEAGLELLARERPCTIYTNSLPLMYHGGNTNSSVIAIGGEVRALSGALVGGMALDWVRHLRFDFAVLGSSALDVEGGVMTTELSEAGIKKAVLERTHFPILAADSAKLDTHATVQYAAWSDFRIWVTDDRLSAKPERRIRKEHGLSAILKTKAIL